jgi:peptide-methionine (S)-S-oxide reductase
MRSFWKTNLLLMAAAAGALACGVVSSSSKPVETSAAQPTVTEVESPKGTQTAVFAGGCFWGVEAVFEHVKGVTDVKSGYAGGDARSADYDKVSGGDTGHAESVLVTFDPAKVSYAQLLRVFFTVAHDPTQLNRQGPDTGTQYRSAIFYNDEAQKAAATAFIQELNESKTFSKPIVTEVTPLKKFYDAEKYHQDYMKRNPNEPYIDNHDKPKVEELKKRFPELYAEK